MRIWRLGIGVGVALGLMVIVIAGTIAAGQELDARVDGFVVEKMKEQKVPGLALGVLRDGKMIQSIIFIFQKKRIQQ